MDEEGRCVALSDRERCSLLPGSISDLPALRILAFAVRTVALKGRDPERIPLSELERDLTLIAIVGLSDSIRTEAPVAIQQCQRAGVEIKMLTGDNAETAGKIAQSCYILRNPYNDGAILEGPEFRRRVLDVEGQLKTAVFEETWQKLKVMARCSPEDKYLLVRGIQSIRQILTLSHILRGD